METDEQIAKELYPESYQVSERIGCIAGIKKGRELSDEKALRFAEWAYIHYWKNSGSQWEDESGKCFTTSELYASKAFEDYLQSLKK